MRHTLLVARIWRVVGRDVVHIQASGETDARFKAIALYKGPRGVLNVLRDLSHGHAGFNRSLCICADLSMNLRCPTDIVVCITFALHCHSFEISFLFICCPPCIAIIGSSKHRVSQGVNHLAQWLSVIC